MKIISIMRQALILLVLPTISIAHHSVGVTFDMGQPVEFNGEIVEVRWQNPHMHFTMKTVVDGAEILMGVEGIPATRLARVGVSPEVLEIGATVSAYGFPSRRYEDEMYATNLLLPDGREVLLDTPDPHWTNNTIGTGRDNTPGELGSDRSLGIFRVWSSAGRGFADRPSDNQLTEQALIVREQWDPFSSDNPFIQCTPTGMPTIMGQPNPMEFVDGGDEIVIRIEEYDIVRVISLEEEPEQLLESIPLGHSFGRWEEDVLVVMTNRIDWRNFSQDGLMQSDSMEVVERFSLNEEGSRLEYEQTITDPWLFIEPYTRTRSWVWVPGDQVRPFECTTLG
ncbi:MAG: hypothetical protein CMD70_07005 [Gammaproteobacteria bacterium]|nr:hypothetical protein [Gammaproteobacteria bacterium]